jgi:hypothetical protein
MNYILLAILCFIFGASVARAIYNHWIKRF